MKKILMIVILFLTIGIPVVMADAQVTTPVNIERTGKHTGKERTGTVRTAALDLTAGQVSYAGGAGAGNPVRNNILDSTEGWKWYRHGDTDQGYAPGTLVLEGIDLSAADDKVLIVPDGTTIVLKGANSITSTYSGDHSCYGVYAWGVLTVTGESEEQDTLAVIGGNPNSPYTVTSTGLYTAGDFIMEGGCVTAAGGSGKFSRGISVQADLIMNGGSLYGLGGAGAPNGSAGLWMAGNDVTVTISRGLLSVTGAPAERGSSYGLYGLFCNIIMSGGELVASGAASGRGSFGVHILTRSAFSCTAGRMTMWGEDMGTNHIPLITGDYQYKTGKTAVSEPSGGWSRGRISDFFSCKYVAVRLGEQRNGEIELG